MARCALKSDCVAYFIFDGGSSKEYPSWYADLLSDKAFVNEYRYWAIAGVDARRDFSIWDDTLTEGYDVFLRNKVGNVMRIDIDELEVNYETIAPGTAAMYDDCIDYVIFTGETDSVYPEWFGDFYYNTLKYYINDKITYPFVVLRKEFEDEDGDLDTKYQVVEYNLFKDNYFYKGHGIPVWEKTSKLSIQEQWYIEQDVAGLTNLYNDYNSWREQNES